MRNWRRLITPLTPEENAKAQELNLAASLMTPGEREAALHFLIGYNLKAADRAITFALSHPTLEDR